MRGEQLRVMYLDGQRRWPHVALAFEQFERHCERVLAEDGDDLQRDAADLFLCCACAVGDPCALQVFETDVLSVAKIAIARIHNDADFVQETLQELRQRLLVGPEARVNQYRGRGPLKAWVRTAAARVALDRASGARALRRVELSEELVALESSPDVRVTKERYGRAFQLALRDAVVALDPQERSVLRMHVVGQCNIDEIGRAYNVHRATAARWIERTKGRIYELVRAELGERRIKLTASEFKSLARLLGGELELNLKSGSRPSTIAVRAVER